MINIKEDSKLNILNHSCAHLLAQAVKHLYPEAKFWVGPVIEDGFYYDIDLGDKVLNDDDIEAISKEMKKLAKDGKRIVRHEISKAEANPFFCSVKILTASSITSPITPPQFIAVSCAARKSLFKRALFNSRI